MYSDCPLLAILENKRSIEIKRICEDLSTQHAISSTFAAATNMMRKDRSHVNFDGKYVPQAEDMDILVIDNYSLPEEIKKALNNPQGLEMYSPTDGGELPKIKALFVGKHEISNGEDHYLVSFQKFRNDQYISASKHHLFFSGNTFVQDTRIGIAVSPHVDCVFDNGQLQFLSYHFAKQILDLSEYYREASAQDIQNFLSCDCITTTKGDEFAASANTWERRKIASINDSGVLSNFTAKQIKSLGKKNGVSIKVENNSVVLPSDRVERRIVLGFLDEEVYTGVFTETLFQTNSKRKAKP